MTESELDSAAYKYVKESIDNGSDSFASPHDYFKAGAQLILKTHVPEADVQILLDALKVIDAAEGDDLSKFATIAFEALQAYQAKRGAT